MNNNTVIYIGIAVVIIAIIAILALGGINSMPSGVTTINKNLTTVTVQPITTTIVPNLTVAAGPNLASCNGYNVSISKAYSEVVGTCNWRGGLLNITAFGGSFQSATLQMVQQNVTLAPYNVSTTAGSCANNAGVVYVPVGNYKVTFQTSLTPQGSCGAAKVRLSIS